MSGRRPASPSSSSDEAASEWPLARRNRYADSSENEDECSDDELVLAAEGSHDRIRLGETVTRVGYRFESNAEDTIRVVENKMAGIAFQTWPAATAMCTYLERHPEAVRGKVTLELGAGTGLVGIMAAKLGASHSILTDLPCALDNMRANVVQNMPLSPSCGALTAGEIDVRPLAWGDVKEPPPRCDVVLASDVVYWEHLFEILLSTLVWLAEGNPGLVILMSHKRRRKLEGRFFKRLAKFFDKEAAYHHPIEGSRKTIAVYKIVRRGGKMR